MSHVFVESNWLFDFAAPAHHQVPEAVDLLERARLGEFTMHLPNVCLGEARRVIRTKCQPRKEADAIRKFVSWSLGAGETAAGNARVARIILDKYESSIQNDPRNLDTKFRQLATLPYLQIFGLDGEMLELATNLILDGIELRPFDQAILAGVLVHSTRLWHSGERGISFCVIDGDLQPWDRYGRPKPPLMDAYHNAHVWIYGDFLMANSPRREDFT